jgi:PAS domain S-box-containing protein
VSSSTSIRPHPSADSSASALARIVVLEPASPGALSPTVRALRRLGAEVSVVSAPDAGACLAQAAEADLVVADTALVVDAGAVLEALRDAGPPVVLVSAAANDSLAREAFRRGASDWVVLSDEADRVLPIVALEQIRRWRGVVERGRVQQRLLRLERWNEAVVRTIPAPIAVIDSGGRVIDVNPEFERAFGVAPAAAAGAEVTALLPGDLVHDGRLAALLREVRSASGEREAVAQATVGDSLRFDVRAARLGDDGHLLLVLWDVTEREHLARRVADLQRENENIIQNMNSALLVVDLEGRITFANATAERILGAEVRGREVWEWFSGAPRERQLLARTLASGARFRGAETVIERGDGTLVPIGISCAPYTDSQGERSGAVAIFQDLSEIKELQRHVLQTEKMASIGQLAAGVAHEINNPMGFIHANLCQMAEYLSDLKRLWAEVGQLQEAAVSGGIAEIRRRATSLASLAREIDAEYVLADFATALRESQEGSERIRHIVQDLRNFSRHDTAQQTLADVTECLDSTASIAWTMMKHSVVLRKDYQDVPRVRCYPMQLKQVFMNLLVNAYQAIQEQVGRSGEIGEIQLATGLRGDHVVVSVTDSGIGIPAENLPRIFDPFFTTKEVGIGTGLGLSTSFNIVQRHGGTLRVESRPGEGSTFEVWLPLTGAADPAPEPAA